MSQTHQEIEITELDPRRPPKYAWCLIGVPIHEFGKVQTGLDEFRTIEGNVIETTVSDADRQP